MKKVDEATGMTIEVPTDMAVRGKFPYPGFWFGIAPSILSSVVEQSRLPRPIASAALEQAYEILNGEFSSILSDRIWRIGEVMNLNSTLKIEGRAGNALGFVNASTDGGRRQIAGMVFVPIVEAINNQQQGVGRGEGQLNDLLAEASEMKRQLQIRSSQLAQIEASTPSVEMIIEQETRIAQHSRAVATLRQDLNTTRARIGELEVTEFRMAESEKEARLLSANIDKLQRELRTANQQGDSAKALQISRQLQPLVSRYQGLELNAKKHGPAQRGIVSELKHLASLRSKQLQNEDSQLAKCIEKLEDMRQMYEIGVTEGRKMWSEIKHLSEALTSMEASVENARNAIGAFSEVDQSRLVRVWSDHLRTIQSEIESLLFKEKARVMDALSDVPKSRLAESVVDPAMVAEHERYVEALTDIGDVLSDEEYELVEEIGRLGISMNFVPGASRIMALAEMGEKARVRAYRNMVEEILSMGQKLPMEERTGLPGFPARLFGDDDGLEEVISLLKHLADSRLEFRYGGE